MVMSVKEAWRMETDSVLHGYQKWREKIVDRTESNDRQETSLSMFRLG